jgi:hypothetical protein
MSSSPFNPTQSSLSAEEIEALFLQLRRKEGGWVEWGKACQALQKEGHLPQDIFERTGFEPIQQNSIIVAAQVYDSIVKSDGPQSLQEFFWRRGSDVLYEFRQLDQIDRMKAAQLACDRNLDMDEAHIIAQDIKAYSRLQHLPDGFLREPGDAIAYFCWKRARERSDLAERSRLIAQGLRYATSSGARTKLEQLLIDFTVVSEAKAPALHFYRLESEEELPRIVPMLGTLPQPTDRLSQVPAWSEQGAFRVIEITPQIASPITPQNTLQSPPQPNATLAWIPLPGWQVILAAQQPIVLMCNSEQLPGPSRDFRETVALVIDRHATQWDEFSYFLIDQSGQLEIAWFPSEPEIPILGQVMLILRPKRILDETVITEPWQLEE